MDFPRTSVRTYKIAFESRFFIPFNQLLPLEPARSEIELVVKSFSGGVELNSEGHFFTDQGGHEYVGPPESAVDEAWEMLLGGQYK
jgi:hypothetical protein